MGWYVAQPPSASGDTWAGSSAGFTNRPGPHDVMLRPSSQSLATGAIETKVALPFASSAFVGVGETVDVRPLVPPALQAACPSALVACYHEPNCPVT